MFRSFAKRLLSTSSQMSYSKDYEQHAITVCSLIAYTTVLSVAHRNETTKQHEEILKKLEIVKDSKKG